jgi:rhodanese-related sulfurtransferase
MHGVDGCSVGILNRMYAGDVTPQDAYRALMSDPDAVLVDVRTHPELVYVGFPDLAEIGKRLVAVEWQTYPAGTQNAAFVQQLADAGIDTSKPVYFLCRSGARSRSAAMVATAAGYEHAYNIGSGFEGVVDQHGHRGSSNGWKAAGLPWRQG